MFKYKSPLSRLLEGAGKSKEEDTSETTDAVETPAAEGENQEPIADFNALRAALAGGNMTSESYEETDELIPEEKMPEFDEAEAEVAENVEESIFAEHTASEDDAPEEILTAEIAEEEEAVEDEQIITLHIADDPAMTPVEVTSASTVVETVEPEAEEAAQEVVTEAAEAPLQEPEQTVEPVAEAVQPTPPVAAPAPTEDRRSRVKTTFLGFERADTHVQELIETSEPVAKTEAAQETFPVGWLVVTFGPGRGASITLTEGLMQIGRNDDQAIQLDFGDTGISRSNHAVIAYDPEDRKCYLGHGGKANLVRLNGKPVLSTVALSSGDLIRISETSIRFTAFCDEGFDWRDS
ncbi:MULTISPECIES: FHA domain-containing protein [unclassified Ruegeria]|uniref:FHA domain-containing protein n=1 Tax=unclassified Ruegeria TaxID=2625375 RepID=UPI001488323D|nr:MULTISPECIES: FHA domain-containing protein [unclassified Ruegeria]NOD76844.1 FHA domain-containing protein [Ruegeria sp. HKCCD4332]NOD88354.1 FHA domain-containing protein [Ruegeria sp. HKCCD4318]NOE13263.1 FHA domain-containing protein [Ruegeria sp. HKCCD4318-2]NOG11195.1 FHA domain-containing protein [Ruegeria sp. HKCCD4315]